MGYLSHLSPDVSLCEDVVHDTLLKVFDINLRLDYYSPEILRASLAHADVLKLNDEELPLLRELYDLSKDVGERDNLVEKNPERAERVAAEIEAWKGKTRPGS